MSRIELALELLGESRYDNIRDRAGSSWKYMDAAQKDAYLRANSGDDYEYWEWFHVKVPFNDKDTLKDWIYSSKLRGKRFMKWNKAAKTWHIRLPGDAPFTGPDGFEKWAKDNLGINIKVS
jgi:hypothetical protein